MIATNYFKIRQTGIVISSALLIRQSVLFPSPLSTGDLNQ